MTQPIRLTVAGHTNTGKTSLLRTLMRNTAFGVVDNSPGTTRHVESATLLAAGQPVVELFDTPGLEDASALLDLLEDARTGARQSGVDRVQRFLGDAAAHDEFEQEAKVLRRVLGSDVIIYVIDAREPVLGKYRDELSILAACARPLIPVLNFVRGEDAGTGQWRSALSEAGLHVVVSYDTVAFDPRSERQLVEALRSVLPASADALERLLAERVASRELARKAATQQVSELLIDVAAYSESIALHGTERLKIATQRLQQQVRKAETECVTRLLGVFGFDGDDYLPDEWPVAGGRWRDDLFSPQALARLGGNVATPTLQGASAGLIVDVLSAGLSLGTGTALGAGVGAVIGGARHYARSTLDWIRGTAQLRVEDSTLRLLQARQLLLMKLLLRRGHASQEQLSLADSNLVDRKLDDALVSARANPHWSRLQSDGAYTTESGRSAAVRALAASLDTMLDE